MKTIFAFCVVVFVGCNNKSSIENYDELNTQISKVNWMTKYESIEKTAFGEYEKQSNKWKINNRFTYFGWQDTSWHFTFGNIHDGYLPDVVYDLKDSSLIINNKARHDTTFLNRLLIAILNAKAGTPDYNNSAFAYYIKDIRDSEFVIWGVSRLPSFSFDTSALKKFKTYIFDIDRRIFKIVSEESSSVGGVSVSDNKELTLMFPSEIKIPLAGVYLALHYKASFPKISIETMKTTITLQFRNQKDDWKIVSK